MRDITFILEGGHLSTLKVPKQFTIFLLVTLDWRQVKRR